MDIINLKENRVFQGDPYGYDRKYVYRNGDEVYYTPSLNTLLTTLRGKGVTPKPARESLPFLLHNSLIPAPQTAYDDIFVLGIGDRLEFGETTQYNCDFRYADAASTEESVPSTKTLLDLLTASVTTHIKGQGVLMLSSGKDSVSLALAINEAGLHDNINAYTYTDPDSGYTNEGEYAAGLCQKIGLKHNLIPLPNDQKNNPKRLTAFL